MKNISNPTLYNVMITFLKDELKQKPIAIGLLLLVFRPKKREIKGLVMCKRNQIAQTVTVLEENIHCDMNAQ